MLPAVDDTGVLHCCMIAAAAIKRETSDPLTSEHCDAGGRSEQPLAILPDSIRAIN